MRLNTLYLTGALTVLAIPLSAGAQPAQSTGPGTAKFPGDNRCSANDPGGRHLRPRLALGGSRVRQAQPMASRALRTA